MSEKRFSWSPANVLSLPYTEYLRFLCIGIGTAVVLVGAASAFTMLAQTALGSDALFLGFAPAAALPKTSIVPIASTTPLTPAHLDIPAIGVHASVEEVGTNAQGNVGTPHTFGDVAWYMLGPRPGESGNTIIDGHVNNALTTAGVFEHLSDLKAGDTIQVADTSGRTLTYVVTQTQTYADANAPLQTIFSTAGPSQLVLITCDGEWLQNAHSFDKRLVVYASLTTS